MAKWPEGPAWREQHRKVLLNFLENELLPRLKEADVWIAPDPAPLTSDEVASIFKTVSEGDRYTRQNFATRTSDHQVVTMLNGIITIEPEPEEWP